MKFLELNTTTVAHLQRLSREELYEMCALLYKEVLVSREAAAITAKLVVEQMARVEEVNRHLEAANAELQQLNNLDELTGIANRRSHDHRLVQEWRRCHRNNSPLSVIMIDIDHFKSYNDHYGHPAGDRCLWAVAQALKLGTRRISDSVARYGGEEFICLLPDCNQESALAVAELIKRRIKALAIPHLTSRTDSHLTVSQGVATAIPARKGSPTELVQRADAALYLAKQKGRDRIVIHEAVYLEAATKGSDGAGLAIDGPAMAPD